MRMEELWNFGMMDYLGPDLNEGMTFDVYQPGKRETFYNDFMYKLWQKRL